MGHGISCCYKNQDEQKVEEELLPLYSREFWFQITELVSLQEHVCYSAVLMPWTYDSCTIPILVDAKSSISEETLQMSLKLRLYWLDEQQSERPLWPHYEFDCKAQVEIYHCTHLLTRRTSPVHSMDQLILHSLSLGAGQVPLDIRVRIMIRMLGTESECFHDPLRMERLHSKSHAQLKWEYTVSEKDDGDDIRVHRMTEYSFTTTNTEHSYERSHSESVMRDSELMSSGHLLQMVLSAYEATTSQNNK